MNIAKGLTNAKPTSTHRHKTTKTTAMKVEKAQLINSQYSSNAFLVCLLTVTGFTIAYLYEIIAFPHVQDVITGARIARIFSGVIRVVGTLFMLLVWKYKRVAQRVTVEQHLRRIDLLMPYLVDSYHVLLTLSFCIRVVTEVVVGQCDGEVLPTSNARACNYFQDTHSIQPSYLISLLILPLLAYILIRETSASSLAVSWLISTATLTWCAAYMQSRLLVPAICLSVFSQAVIYYDAKRQHDDMCRLVTALRNIVAENERLQEEARASELRAMIGNVAHDLKTPLTSILSGIEVIQDTLQKLEDECAARPGSTTDAFERISPHLFSVRACLKSMLGSSSFMTMCINRCLDYTKASNGMKLVPKPETVNLQEALDFPISIMRDVQTQLPITLAPVPGEICSHIITDKQWLMENLLCLLSNAVRYSQAGSVAINVFLQRPTIESKMDKDVNSGASLRIEVCDSGIGLTDEVMATLFAPFKQAQRLAGGTGLGLFSLAKRVEALRGQYGVCKRPDGAQGSMFWFSIPYRPDDLSAVTARVPRHQSSNFTHDASFNSSASELGIAHERRLSAQDYVLVVDDAPSILKMTAMLLTRKGYIVDKAVNGAEAVNLVLKRVQDDLVGYDAVLLDLQMPVMDGIEAIRRIRAAERRAKDGVEGSERRAGDVESGGKAWQYQARTRRQLIIALSANSDSDTMQEALDAGADHFMSKPFTYDKFCELMDKQ